MKDKSDVCEDQLEKSLLIYRLCVVKNWQSEPIPKLRLMKTQGSLLKRAKCDAKNNSMIFLNFTITNKINIVKQNISKSMVKISQNIFCRTIRCKQNLFYCW